MSNLRTGVTNVLKIGTQVWINKPPLWAKFKLSSSMFTDEKNCQIIKIWKIVLSLKIKKVFTYPSNWLLYLSSANCSIVKNLSIFLFILLLPKWTITIFLWLYYNLNDHQITLSPNNYLLRYPQEKIVIVYFSNKP